MRYFLDTEFIEDGETIDLISLGVVAEDGREFYAQNPEAKFRRGTDWLWRNVYPSLEHFDMRGERACKEWPTSGGIGACILKECPWRHRYTIRDDFRKFINLPTDRPEFWGYYADYDWVAVCQLFGTMMELPQGWPMYMMDIKQYSRHLENRFSTEITLPEQGKGEHNALADARWNKEAFEFLMKVEREHA